jgi:hypothetical protein
VAKQVVSLPEENPVEAGTVIRKVTGEQLKQDETAEDKENSFPFLLNPAPITKTC